MKLFKKQRDGICNFETKKQRVIDSDLFIHAIVPRHCETAAVMSKIQIERGLQRENAES